MSTDGQNKSININKGGDSDPSMMCILMMPDSLLHSQPRTERHSI